MSYRLRSCVNEYFSLVDRNDFVIMLANIIGIE